jgi:hypothetical protein
MQQLLQASDVQICRVVASQLGGRMLMEAEAPDQKSLEAFFEARRFNIEWVMRIDLDAKEGRVAEY